MERSPDAVAVVFEGEQLTYRELNVRANQLAHYLQNLGVKPEVLVGISIERSFEMIVGILGILKAGGAYVPIDPAYPSERIAYMLSDSQVRVLLTQQSLVDLLIEYQGQVVCFDSEGKAITSHNSQNLISGVKSKNLAYVIYTSGSTGNPKGVSIEHRALVNHMNWMQINFPLQSDDRVLQKTPFSFDASIWEFYAPLLVGSQLAIAKPDGHRDAQYLIHTIQNQGITTLQVVPSLLRLLVETPGFEQCHSLKHIFCGGEALSTELVRRCQELVNTTVINLYGPTEGTIDSTYFCCRDLTNQQLQTATVPIGRPIHNCQVYLLARHLQPVPIGVTGELYIGGAGVARGYLNRPDLTNKKFIPNPGSSGDIMLNY